MSHKPLQELIFTPNIPYQLKLKCTEGRLVHSTSGDDLYYTLAELVPFQDNDGNELWANCVYLPIHVGERINAQRFQPGEPFFVRKARKDKRGTKVQWDLWRRNPDEVYPSPNVERAAMATGIPATAVERAPRASFAPNNPEYVAANAPTRAEPVPINRNTRAPVELPLRPGYAAEARIASLAPPCRNGKGKNGKPSGLLPEPPSPGDEHAPPPPPRADGNFVMARIPLDIAMERLAEHVKDLVKKYDLPWSEQQQQEYATTALILMAESSMIATPRAWMEEALARDGEPKKTV